MNVNVFAIRHGETAWSLSGKHTGTTDIPLTDNGRLLAERMRPVLARNVSGRAFCSPMQRAAGETCELAGFGQNMTVDPDLAEWNYGEYESKTPEEIHKVKAGLADLPKTAARVAKRLSSVGARVDPGYRTHARSSAAIFCCSRTDTCCAYWQRAGLGCPRVAASTFSWIQARCASSATTVMYRL